MTDEELKAEWLKQNKVKKLPDAKVPAEYDDLFDMNTGDENVKEDS